MHQKVCLFVSLTAVLFGGAFYSTAAEYRYRHANGEVVLESSPRLTYVKETASSTASFAAATSGTLKRNRLSDHFALKGAGTVYEKIPVKKGAASAMSLQSFTASAAQSANMEWQPVFEQGMATLIPTERVKVAFEAETSTAEAEIFFDQTASAQGILSVEHHRKNTFIVTIDEPSGGRAFDVATALSELNGIDFAEPSFRFIANDLQAQDRVKISKPACFTSSTVDAASVSPALSTETATESSASSPNWVTIASLDFENGTEGWTSQSMTNITTASWGRTTYRSYGGSYSLYCAQTLRNAPGPYVNDMDAWFYSPAYNLSAYEEVYIEAWFYTDHEADYYSEYEQAFTWDYPVLVVFEDSQAYGTGRYLITGYTGDLTADSTTQNGWRKVLYRVPASYLGNATTFALIFSSDYSVTQEGTYIDNIRIVGTTNVDTDPLGNDTYAARLWSHRNTGQIAGLGGEDNDMNIPEAWDLVDVSPSVVVAVVDDGVDLTHPDLNLVTGYDYDGSVGGEARGSHGTACAGEVGAIRNNGIGTIGTAPGVKIMPVYTGEYDSTYAAAIDVAVANGANVLSCSWGAVDWYSSDIEDAIDDAIAAGCVVLFAAGNGPDRYPWTYEVAFPGSLAASKDMICVGGSSPTDEHKSASSSDGEFSWGSSYVNNGPDLVACTTWSYTTDIQGSGGYNTNSASSGVDTDYCHDFTGTSAATPKAAGVAALMLSANYSLTPAEVKAALINTADDIGNAGTDDKTGAGRINAYMAVSSVAGDAVESITVTASGTTITLYFTGNAYGDFELLSSGSLSVPDWSSETNLTLDGSGSATFTDVLDHEKRFYKTE